MTNLGMGWQAQSCEWTDPLRPQGSVSMSRSRRRSLLSLHSMTRTECFDITAIVSLVLCRYMQSPSHQARLTEEDGKGKRKVDLLTTSAWTYVCAMTPKVPQQTARSLASSVESLGNDVSCLLSCSLLGTRSVSAKQ